jgi:hypothetical protein
MTPSPVVRRVIVTGHPPAGQRSAVVSGAVPGDLGAVPGAVRCGVVVLQGVIRSFGDQVRFAGRVGRADEDPAGRGRLRTEDRSQDGCQDAVALLSSSPRRCAVCLGSTAMTVVSPTWVWLLMVEKRISCPSGSCSIGKIQPKVAVCTPACSSPRAVSCPASLSMAGLSGTPIEK